ncbi:hypothetical protein K9M78_04610 [Candidatus Bipolaricaulota bacterium]|nr:hypothetical protein [Candidatus Bipolaricaulota bacterium]
MNEVMLDDFTKSNEEKAEGSASANKNDASNIPTATVNLEMSNLTDKENVRGGSGDKSKKESEEEHDSSSFDGSVDIYYDDSI